MQVKRIPLYLKYTSGTIKLLEKINIQSDYLLAKADVALLYTCIPHSFGI